MKNSILQFSLLLLIIGTLSCSKDEEESPSTSAPQNYSIPTGPISAVVSEQNLEWNAFAWQEDLSEITILTQDNGESEMKISLYSFVGSATYSITESNSNNIQYKKYVNGNLIKFDSDEGGFGSVTITEFNETTKTISGTFNFSIEQTNSSSNTINVHSGTFTNIPIFELPQPAIGEALVYSNGELHHFSNICASEDDLMVTNIILDCSASEFPIRFRGNRNYQDSPQWSLGYLEGFTVTRNYAQSTVSIENSKITFGDEFVGDLNHSTKTVTISVKFGDFEMRMNQVPFEEFHPELNSSELYYIFASDTIIVGNPEASMTFNNNSQEYSASMILELPDGSPFSISLKKEVGYPGNYNYDMPHESDNGNISTEYPTPYEYYYVNANFLLNSNESPTQFSFGTTALNNIGDTIKVYGKNIQITE